MKDNPVHLAPLQGESKNVHMQCVGLSENAPP